MRDIRSIYRDTKTGTNSREIFKYCIVFVSDVFKKFKDNNGKFKESITDDVMGILHLYEATFMSMHGEDILDEAADFAKPLLESLTTRSSPHLAEYINNALTLPFHRGLSRLEARKYISFYGKEKYCNETLLKFAKLDFNRVQSLYRQELGDILK